ncbi:MAG: hypothetical protein V7L02_30720 [Nostoc sp.]|uniref:hypothetical protein n=1 Tax=Nostoc sp. TaxID=1180 RepID=UPI002FFC9EE3
MFDSIMQFRCFLAWYDEYLISRQLCQTGIEVGLKFDVDAKKGLRLYQLHI